MFLPRMFEQHEARMVDVCTADARQLAKDFSAAIYVPRCMKEVEGDGEFHQPVLDSLCS